MANLLFDFNGTLSDDEPLMCGIFRELFAEVGRPLSEQEYFERLAGFSDPEIVELWLGPAHPRAAELVARKIAVYRERVADGSTVAPETREAVREAAARDAVAVVSGSARAEIEPVLEAADIRDAVTAIVAIEDVARGKPDPGGYLRALELLGVAASNAIAVEDSPPGIAAAKAAGVYCVALAGTFAPERLTGADEVVHRIDRALVRRLVS
jgi:beta-phosphoglucomutase